MAYINNDNSALAMSVRGLQHALKQGTKDEIAHETREVAKASDKKTKQS